MNLIKKKGTSLYITVIWPSEACIRAIVVARWTASQLSDRSPTRGMIHNKIPLINPGYPRPSIALQVQNRGLKHHSLFRPLAKVT